MAAGRSRISDAVGEARGSAGRATAARWWVFLATALFVASQWPILTYYWEVWNSKNTYYSHGPLVPGLVALIVWLNRRRLALSADRGSWWGVLILAASSVVFLIGLAFGWEPLCGVSLIISAFAVLWALFGRASMRVLLVPVIFVSTMIPPPDGMLDGATARYQLISSSIAAQALRLAGHTVSLQGNVITSDSLPESLHVGGPCSGLKLLIALIMCSWFIAYMVESTGWRKAGLVALSLPLSIVVNSLRVVLIAFVGIWTYSSSAVIAFHDYSGYIGLLLCVGIVYGLARVMGMREFRDFDMEFAHEAPRRGVVFGVPAASVMAVLLALAVVGSAVGGLYRLPKGKLDRSRIPMRLGEWTGVEIPVGESTREVLSKGDLMQITYTSLRRPGRSITVLLDASLDVTAFHDPGICLPGNGYTIKRDETVSLFSRDRGMPPISAALIELEGPMDSAALLYWYECENHSLPRPGDLISFIRRRRLEDLTQLLGDPGRFGTIRQNVLRREVVWFRFTTGAAGEGDSRRLIREFAETFAARFQRPGPPHLGN